MSKFVLTSIIVTIFGILIAFLIAYKKYQAPINIEKHHLTSYAKNQVECLANNVFFESAYEPEDGKIAVAFVTLNRVNSGYFPKNICDVVKQKVQSVCQFSWYCEEQSKRLSYSKSLTSHQKEAYNVAYNVALYVYANYGRIKDPTKGALFYHATYVNPKWKNMIKTALIGQHIFYIRKDLL